jgi:putative transposase
MRQHGIQSKMSKKYVITTDSKNTLKPAPDRLKRQFSVDAPDKAWVSDTTFIPTRQGWLYLAVVVELYSRQVLG